ncbi:MAG: Spi family protease inhibitor [Muribaculaceae bacterium]|nr:Spi family protease inhibitor [Muribaculaceae bacterium]
MCGLRSVEEAVTLAKSMAAARGKASRSGGAVEVANVAAIGSNASRSGADTLLYAVNFADDAGYTLVSAAKYGEAVLGYTEEGSFDAERAQSNPNFSYYLEAAKDYVSDNLVNGGVIIDPSTPVTTSEKIYPRIMVEYGQQYPEGELFENGYSGCTQTATAMIFSFVGEPKSITYTCPDIDMDSEVLDWGTLKLHTKSIKPVLINSITNHDKNCSASSETHAVLSRLCREIGYRNKAQIESPTLTTVNFTMSYLNIYNILYGHCTTYQYNPAEGTFYDTLAAQNCVIWISGRTSEDAEIRDGYVWLCDGGEKQKITSKAQLANGEWETRVEYKYYNHFNWGDCGNDNGYFLSGVFTKKDGFTTKDYKYNITYFIIKK